MSFRKTGQQDGLSIASESRREEVGEMNHKQSRFRKLMLGLGAATVTLMYLPCSAHAQSSTLQAQPSTSQTQPSTTQAQPATPQTQPSTTQEQPSTPQTQPSATQEQSPNPQDRQAVQGNDNRTDNDRRDVASFDRFLDEHREIAEQVRKDPSLLDNRDFLRDHPALRLTSRTTREFATR